MCCSRLSGTHCAPTIVCGKHADQMARTSCAAGRTSTSFGTCGVRTQRLDVGHKYGIPLNTTRKKTQESLKSRSSSAHAERAGVPAAHDTMWSVQKLDFLKRHDLTACDIPTCSAHSGDQNAPWYTVRVILFVELHACNVLTFFRHPSDPWASDEFMSASPGSNHILGLIFGCLICCSRCAWSDVGVWHLT